MTIENHYFRFGDESMDGDSHRHKAESLTDEEQDTAEGISVKQLQRLIRLIDASDVAEIEVRRIEEGTRLVLRKVKAPGGSNLVAEEVAMPAIQEETPVETKHTVVAPLVGIFHSWAKPKGRALVAVGDHVKVGQLIGTIQSLNVLNEVESLVAGSVVEILVQDGQPVEYGQPLMTIDTAEEG